MRYTLTLRSQHLPHGRQRQRMIHQMKVHLSAMEVQSPAAHAALEAAARGGMGLSGATTCNLRKRTTGHSVPCMAYRHCHGIALDSIYSEQWSPRRCRMHE
jgi:hypothetical protein